MRELKLSKKFWKTNLITDDYRSKTKYREEQLVEFKDYQNLKKNVG